MSTSSAKAKESAAPATPAPIVPPENQAAYEETRLWREPPWGDTYWCDQCSTCMRWRYSARMGGRVCVTAFNFNFPLVIIENGRCNEYRPVPGAEGLWNDEYSEEEEDYGGAPRRRDGEPLSVDEEEARRHVPARRRPRRRARRGGGAPAGPAGI